MYLSISSNFLFLICTRKTDVYEYTFQYVLSNNLNENHASALFEPLGRLAIAEPAFGLIKLIYINIVDYLGS